ncbi:MAG: Holliday junction branch migration protein RuvA [Candidatus Moranbacteria bacterium]|jgi:Holliday junction DNA helicase RuvA|nr:Holliday junction branch migration protein RuvA [Candidatus Moranbacteria bacterium]MDD5651955.1 Holliday junction branch migration protein RuvA [Candidatus Moranbacteria bacterium]MDX9855902.1 Holliday junction branch migration protein RuvA [Candidatus Moranbacteria bacterium]
MIAKLKGKIEHFQDNWVIVDVNDIGYKVFLSDFTFGKLAGKDEIVLHIYTYVREDILALYGFLDMAEKEMFELLISISGIGPKAAMGILSVADPKSIQVAILNDDSSILTKVSGVGKKTAERVILELQNKVADISLGDREQATSDSEAVEALMTMGYSASQSREALKNIPKESASVEEKIKAALKELGR